MVEVIIEDGISVRVYPESAYVETVLYVEKWKVMATREPTVQNVHEARCQGYKGTDNEVVWNSLLDHEIAHVVVGSTLFGISAVMRFESGMDPKVPYYLRLWEEAIVIALQHWKCNAVAHLPEPLMIVSTREQRRVWIEEIQRVRERIDQKLNGK